MEVPVARVSLQAVVFQPEAERRARPADDPHVSHARGGLLELTESMIVSLSEDFSFLVSLSCRRFLRSTASASHGPPGPRSSGPEYRAIQTEHRVVQTENRVAVTTRSTPLPSNGAKRASACVPESLLMPGVPAWVQLSKDETQWVLQQLQGIGEKRKIAPRIWAWPAGHP